MVYNTAVIFSISLCRLGLPYGVVYKLAEGDCWLTTYRVHGLRGQLLLPVEIVSAVMWNCGTGGSGFGLCFLSLFQVGNLTVSLVTFYVLNIVAYYVHVIMYNCLKS